MVKLHVFLCFALISGSILAQTKVPDNLLDKEGIVYTTLSNQTYTGKYRYTLANGQDIEKGEYLNGRKNGKWQYWYLTGTIKREENYLNGKLNGIQKKWYPNGQLSSISYYSDGLKTGNWLGYYENGQAFYNIHYKNDKEEGQDKWTDK